MFDTTVAIDGDDPSTTMYFQTSNGKIYKWASNIRYVANNGTLWADRVGATYVCEAK